jgi:hypothetical protein
MLQVAWKGIRVLGFDRELGSPSGTRLVYASNRNVFSTLVSKIDDRKYQEINNIY